MKHLNLMKPVFLYVAIISMVLTACNEDDDSVDSLKMTIEGTVYDAETSSPLADAIIKINTDGKTDSTTTNENGIFSLGDYPTGEYTIYISKDNYLTTSESVSSSSEIAITDNTETVVTNTNIDLTPMNQSVNVTVYKYNEDASSTYVTLAAANVPFTVYVDALNQYTGTTTDEGLISLDNMPYNTYITFIFDFEEDGVTYTGSESYYTGKENGYITVYGTESSNEVGDFGLVTTNITNSYGAGVEDFDISDAIVLNFTQSVDTENEYISFTLRNSSYDYYDFSTVWSNDNKTVTITPGESLESGIKYRFYFDVYNEDGEEYSDYIYFYTE